MFILFSLFNIFKLILCVLFTKIFKFKFIINGKEKNQKYLLGKTVKTTMCGTLC